MKYRIVFYQRENDSYPALDFINSLEISLQTKVLDDLRRLGELGFLLKGGKVKAIQGKEYKGLYELRSKKSRLLNFVFTGTSFVILSGFTKKSNKTPTRELDKAVKYMEDHVRRHKDE